MEQSQGVIHLEACLGDSYVNTDWHPALTVVMDAEGDVTIAVKAIKPLADAAAHHTGLKIHIPALTKPPPGQLHI
ncbi:hypothetical protein BKA82DRAFT_162322 [Pisolithus tinctorius]|uniref:Uncharacterized protein n=1 Tax=Pisolithus tinctorius Marx 270 TaxID=870435 RepID=A0A0C3IIA8_PISTI|nr:hypothetical protein BKA82DRAFT_162322 [Pisolithus tinctorius]KIN96757.1 hypothetical protein M404DRAFT_162322 [Pisolithus tinctorius Marx 270]